MFSSPFLGTFFQSTLENAVELAREFGFRPLSWGLSFNNAKLDALMAMLSFSSPFLGTFFQLDIWSDDWAGNNISFRPLSWGLSFNWKSEN